MKKRFILEIQKTFESEKKEWLIAMESDDYKACERKAHWYRNKTNLGWYIGYTKDELQNIRIYDNQKNTFTNL